MSKYVDEIIDVWKNEGCNILISAAPGSGKTTTLLKLIEELKGNYLFLAFNKSIQEEINSKLENKKIFTSTAKTLHSFGRSALVSKYTFGLTMEDKRYLDLIIGSCVNRFLKNKNNGYKPRIRALTGKEAYQIAYYVKAMFDFGRMYMCIDDLEQIETILIENGYYEPDVDKKLYINVYKDLVSWYKKELEKDQIIIDFTDMIFIPAYLNLTPNMYGYDYLLVDESQDLSVMQHAFIDLIVPKVKKWVAVGDNFQSIYSFAGAHSDAFSLFKNKDNVKVLPLSVTYRCPPEIVDLMDKVRPGHTQPYKESDPNIRTVIYNMQEDEYHNIPDGAMVICRNSSPLFKMYFALLGQDRKVFIKGADIYSKISRFCKKYSKEKISVARSKMSRDLEKLFANKDRSDKDFFKWYSFDENFTNFNLLNANLRGSRIYIEDFLNSLKRIFNTKGKGIMLMTIHKSKGLEADFVGFLDEHLIPSKFANTPDQIEQEKNLRFVALSRTKTQLAFIYTKENDS